MLARIFWDRKNGKNGKTWPVLRLWPPPGGNAVEVARGEAGGEDGGDHQHAGKKG